MTLELTKGVSALEERVKTELVHGVVQRKMHALEFKIDALKADGGTTFGGVGANRGRKPITAYNSIQNLKILNSDGYFEWKDKLENKKRECRTPCHHLHERQRTAEHGTNDLSLSPLKPRALQLAPEMSRASMHKSLTYCQESKQ